MGSQTVIELDPALANAVESVSAPSEDELQRKLEVLRRLEADVERFETAKTRAEASAAKARRRCKDARSARDAAARDLAIAAKLAGVEIRARGAGRDATCEAAPGAVETVPGDVSAAGM